MRFTFRLLAAVMAFAGVVGSANAAPIIIDSFTQGTYSASGFGVPKNGSSGAQPISTGILANRTTSHASTDAITTFGTNEGVLLNSGSALGNLELSSIDNTSVSVTLGYALGGILNLNGGQGLTFEFGGIEEGESTNEFEIEILVNGSILTTYTYLDGQPLTFEIFEPLWAGLDITDIQITLNAKSNFGTDFRLFEIRTDDGTFTPFGDPEVPEPASMVVFGVLALGGAFVARRKLLAKKLAA